MKTKETPHYIGHRKRLRSRFLKTAGEGLEDYEILELLLSYCIPRRDTKPLAKRLLSQFGSLTGVLDASYEELKQTQGLGEISAVLIKVTRRFVELYLREKTFNKEKRLSSPTEVVHYCRASMGGLKDEQFRAIYLNSQNQVIQEVVIQEGTVDQAVVYPRKVLEYALQFKATGVIIVHNHPSGSLQPSRSDIELTRKLKNTAAEMGIRVLDHLIVTRTGYFSFTENALL
jgi:DNA repair protein RadC